MNQSPTPYACHLFVCLNDRHGERKACADGGAATALRAYFKAEVERRGWKGRVRVSQSGCMGLCAKGPNVMLYPGGIWFSGVTQADGEAILSKIEELLG